MIEIVRSARDAMIAHARESLPNECCGLLIGPFPRIALVMPARNLEESPTRFQLDPLDHFAAIRQARMRGEQLIGVYHSHPGGPETPSERDRLEASYPDYVYVIVSPSSPSVRAFQLDDGNFSEVPLVTVG